MITKFSDYHGLYDHFHLTRSDDGVLTIRLHKDDGPLIWDLAVYEQLHNLLANIDSDGENQIVILTGTGDAFVAGADLGDPSESGTPSGYDPYYHYGSQQSIKLMNLRVPVIAALNGPVMIHTELPLLSDIVIATPGVAFKDGGHIPGGIVPGDGCQVIWEELLGPVRAKYFLLMGQTIQSDQALSIGAVGEIVQPDQLMPRAKAIARQLLQIPPLTRRYTRMALNQRLLRRFSEAVPYGMALEGLSLVEAIRSTR